MIDNGGLDKDLCRRCDNKSPNWSDSENILKLSQLDLLTDQICRKGKSGIKVDDKDFGSINWKKRNFSFLRLERLYEEYMRKDNRSSVWGLLFIQVEKSGRLPASEIKRRRPDWRGKL